MKRRIADLKMRQERMRSTLAIDSDETLELAESIREIGLINPITIDPEGYILAGERRFLACQLAGLDEVDVTVSEADPIQVELEENTKRLDLPWPDRARGEVRLFDRMKEKDPGWTQKRQATTLQQSESRTWMFLRLGRALAERPHLEGAATAKEAIRLLEEEEAREERGDPKTPKHLVHAPDWAWDRYVLGDALVGLSELAASQPQQRGMAAHLAFVDPPGRDSYEGDRKVPLTHMWQKFEGKYSLTAKLVRECMMPNAYGLFWFEGMEEHDIILRILRNSGWWVGPTPAIWVKHQISATPGPDTTLGTAFQPFLVARNGQPKLGRPGRSNVFTYPEGARIAHNEKPYALCQEILKTFCFPNSRVLIPFLGSGNMLRAATAAGHLAWGWEIVAEYKNRFLKRVEEDRTAFDQHQERLKKEWRGS